MVRIHWFIFNWVDANDCPILCVCVCKNPPWNGCMMHVSGFHLWLYTTPINCLNYLANLSLSHSYIYIYIRSGIYLTFLVIFHVCRCFSFILLESSEIIRPLTFYYTISVWDAHFRNEELVNRVNQIADSKLDHWS